MPPRDRMPSWLSTADVARELGMSPQWVRRQVAERRLGARVFVTGRRRTIRIERSSLEAFISLHVLDPRSGYPSDAQ